MAKAQPKKVIIPTPGQDRIENIMARAICPYLNAHPVDKEIKNLINDARAGGRLNFCGLGQKLRQGKSELICNNDSIKAEPSTAERIRVSGAGGLLADAEESYQQVNFIS